jgi:hypothetical protein
MCNQSLRTNLYAKAHVLAKTNWNEYQNVASQRANSKTELKSIVRTIFRVGSKFHTRITLYELFPVLMNIKTTEYLPQRNIFQC